MPNNGLPASVVDQDRALEHATDNASRELMELRCGDGLHLTPQPA